MEKQFRLSLILALCGLALMPVSRSFVPDVPVLAPAPVVLGARDGYTLYAESAPPEGEERTFDRETLYGGLLLYVSPEVPLPERMPAQQARDVRGMVHLYLPAAEQVALSQETIYALCDLVRENPLVKTWIMTGMRSPREQENLQAEIFRQYQEMMPVGQALAAAARDVPDSGKSEHQLNTAFDVQFHGALDWSAADPMERSEDGRWLLANGWRFGLIRRYPPDKTAVTGISNEALHLRYIGRAHAAAMHAAADCLEEYLRLLHEKGCLRLSDPGGGDIWLLCGKMTEDTAVFRIPSGFREEVSADNLGYAVCALIPEGRD